MMVRPRFSRHTAAISVVLLAAAGAGQRAGAQHTPDPYNIVGEYNVGYENFMYPTYPNGAGFSSNQGILQGRAGVTRANQFQSYLDSIMGFGGTSEDSLFGTSRRGTTSGQPYYRAHRQFDEAFDRVYTPNETPDQTFRADQEARTKLYIEYLKEPDPKKRAELYRRYTQQSLRAARDFGAGAARASQRTRSPNLAPAPPGSASLLPPPSALSASPASRANSLRRSSETPSALSRARSSLAPTRRSETPEEILDRATRRSPAPADTSAPPGSGSLAAPR
jgi:hypothetical protein